MAIASVWQRIQLSKHLSKRMALSSLASAAIQQNLWRTWSGIQASGPALKHYVTVTSGEGGKRCMKLSKDAGGHALKLVTEWGFAMLISRALLVLLHYVRALRIGHLLPT